MSSPALPSSQPRRHSTVGRKALRRLVIEKRRVKNSNSRKTVTEGTCEVKNVSNGPGSGKFNATQATGT